MIELTIIGNCGAVRMHSTPKTNVLTVSIASNHRSGEKDYTEWVSAKIWGERAESLLKHISVGQRLLVRGRPQINIFDREDGTKAHELTCHVSLLEFLGPKPDHLSLKRKPVKEK